MVFQCGPQRYPTKSSASWFATTCCTSTLSTHLLGEPYFTKGKQWPQLVQWSYKEIKSEPNQGENATCDKVWSVEQKASIVSKMMHSSHLQTGQRHVSSTAFPSLDCAKAKIQAGEVVHDVHQTCLQAIGEGGLNGDIHTRTKERFGNQDAVRALNQKRPDYFLLDYEGVAPTYITPQRPTIHIDPFGAEWAGPAT